MAKVVEEVVILKTRMETIAEDTASCRKNLHALRSDVQSQSLSLRNDMSKATTLQIAERKSDRRWLIGTCLSTAGLIIAAIAILAGHVG